MASNIRGITVEIGGDTTKLSNSLSKVNSQSKSLQNELKSVNNLLKLDPKNTELLSQKQNILKEAIDSTKDKLTQLKSVQDQVKRQYESGEIDSGAYRAFQREILNTEEKLKKLENQAKSFGSVTAQKIAVVGTEVQNLGNKIEATGKKFTAISATSGVILSGSIMSASNFEDAMAKVNTIADTSQTSLSDLKTQILALSNQTGISCDDIADNVYNAISAGQQTADAVNFVSNATSLAKAGFADTGDALDILTTILNAYHLEASKVTDVSDMLIQTQNKGKTTVAELSSSMGKIIPTANSMNVALDQVCAGYAIMTANGIATAESTTYMNSMLNELGKSSTTVGKILKEKTGKSFQDLMKDGKSIGDVLKILQDYSKKSGTAFNELWSSAEAGKAGLTLLSNGVDGFNEMAKGMVDSTGATASAMEKLETPSLKVKKAVNQVKNAGVDLGTTALSALIPVLEKIASLIQQLTLWFSGLNNTTKTIIVTVLGLLTTLTPILLLISKVITSVGTIMTLAPKISGAIKGIVTIVKGLFTLISTHPIVGVIAGIVALILYLWNNCEWFRDNVKKALEIITDFFKNAWETIKNVWKAMPSFFEKLWNNIKSVYSTVATVMGGFFHNAWNIIKAPWEKVTIFFSTIWNSIKSVFNLGVTFIINVFALAWLGIKTVWDVVSGYFEAIWNTIKGIFSVVKDVLHGNFSEAWEAIKNIVGSWADYFSTIWETIKLLFAGVVGFFSNIFTSARDAISTVFATLVLFFANLWEGVKLVFSTVIEFFTMIFSNAWEGIKSAFSTIGEFFSNVFNNIKNAFISAPETLSNIFTSAWNNIKSVFSNVGNFFGDVINNIKNAFTNLPNQMKLIGKNIIDGLTSGIRSKVDSVVNAVKDIGNKITGKVKSILGIASPSRVMKAFGAYTSEGLAIGIKEKGNLASDAMENVVDDVIGKTNQSTLLKLGVNGSDVQTPTANESPKSETVINFNGNYQFKDRDDIDYLLNEAGLRLAGVR